MLASGALRDWPFAVVDLETTGVNPREDRIVEISVAVLRRDEPPTVIFDTLIDPERPIPGAASRVHGICDDDVQGAPTFREVAPGLLALFANRLIAGHNARFDIAFLEEELALAGHPVSLPYVCTMNLPSLLSGAPSNRPLWWLAAQFSVPSPPKPHTAATDALAAARVLRAMLRRAGRITIEQLQARARRTRKAPAFLQSLENPVLPAIDRLFTPAGMPLQSRTPHPEAPLSLAQRYLRAVLAAASDLKLDHHELGDLRALQAEMPAAEIDRVHAKVWQVAMRRYTEDERFDERERRFADRLQACLSQLGWSLPPNT